jgi:hypothetical protein
LDDFDVEILDHHFKRLSNIAQTAIEINKEIGIIWHQKYKNKEYDNQDFKIVEEIYKDTKDMAVNLLDFSSMANQL